MRDVTLGDKNSRMLKSTELHNAEEPRKGEEIIEKNQTLALTIW
jgi:hypothetical protein